jgi:hypothetical protein
MFYFSVRFRSLEDDGFLRKKAAIVPEQSHVTIKLEPDVKNDSDDEDLFEFPSDKKARLTACEPANEDDEDIFAFADDVKPKPLRLPAQKVQPVESSELPKKRKFENGDTTCELNSFSKRPVLEKDVRHQQITESYKNEPMEHSVSAAGFLSVVQGTKVSCCHNNSFKIQCSHILFGGHILKMAHIPKIMCTQNDP